MRKGDRKPEEKRRVEKPPENGKGRDRPRQAGSGRPHRISTAGRDGLHLEDYSVYEFSAAQWVKYLAVYALLDGCISYLFFRSVLAFVILAPGAVIFVREQKKTLQKKRKREMTRQFMDAIQLMLSALQAGYSPENSLSEALKELTKIYDKNEIILKEFRQMNAQIGMSRNIEDLLMDFGRRSDIADIVSFAEVFMTAKRTGGDLIMVIQNTVSCIRQKQETMDEIETSLSGKVMEQNIMSMIPILILAYVKITSPYFLDVMYESAAGIAVMTVCFIVYLLAYIWGQSIMRIEV